MKTNNNVFGEIDSQIKMINTSLKDETPLNVSSTSIESLYLLQNEGNEQSEYVLDIVKKSRKLNFNDISFARRSYEESVAMNKRYGLDVRYTPDYHFTVQQLYGKSIDMLIKGNKERDSYWVLDFAKDLVDTVKKEIDNDSNYKFVEGRMVKTNLVTPKTVKKYVKNLMNINPLNGGVDKEFLLLLEDVIQHSFEIESIGAPFVIEEGLKIDLLNNTIEELESNFSENTIDELIQYNIYHCMNREESKKILSATKLLVNEGYSPKDISLNVDDDWVYQINSFLNGDVNILDNEFGYNEVEEEKKVNVDFIKEIRNEKKEKKSKAVSDNAKQSISIRCILTGEIISFETKGDCMKFLKTSPNTFAQFLKGKSKLNKKYTKLENR